MLTETGATKLGLARKLCGSSKRTTICNARNQIAWWANGKVTPKPATVERLAKLLDCDVKDLCVEVDL
ncbi:helix-turn-helix domain-containing protein [Nonomuraea sp. NPDC048826]|uniref:helix-turn-helix domain-containing protein n=1 Tax=Nonomuraea sp. NPDC048826 TaxID=3364347 RepID=UPI0037193CD6